MIAYFLSKELCPNRIILAQSFWFSTESPLNFVNQSLGSWNIGPSKICFEDWLRSPQSCKCSTSKLKKIFSARCWRPGLFKIFSNMLSFLDRPGLVMIFSILDDCEKEKHHKNYMIKYFKHMNNFFLHCDKKVFCGILFCMIETRENYARKLFKKKIKTKNTLPKLKETARQENFSNYCCELFEIQNNCGGLVGTRLWPEADVPEICIWSMKTP